mgnify:CR=1 FL=1
MKHVNRRWRSVLCLLVMISFAGSAGAQELDGTWEMTISVPEASQTFTITLVTDGEKVTGTRGEDKYTGTFKDGQLELSGNHFVDEAGQYGMLTLSGTIDGDRISGGGTFDYMEVTLEGTRAK